MHWMGNASHMNEFLNEYSHECSMHSWAKFKIVLVRKPGRKFYCFMTKIQGSSFSFKLLISIIQGSVSLHKNFVVQKQNIQKKSQKWVSGHNAESNMNFSAYWYEHQQNISYVHLFGIFLASCILASSWRLVGIKVLTDPRVRWWWMPSSYIICNFMMLTLFAYSKFPSPYVFLFSQSLCYRLFA